MEWLTDWDDLKHGTAVFSAAVPFLVAFLLAWKLPTRWWFFPWTSEATIPPKVTNCVPGVTGVNQP